MNKKLITIWVIASAVGLGVLMMANRPGTTVSDDDAVTSVSADGNSVSNTDTPPALPIVPTDEATEEAGGVPDQQTASVTAKPVEDSDASAAAAPPVAVDVDAIEGLHVAEPTRESNNAYIGSDTPDGAFKIRAETTTWGAGIWRISLSDYRMAVEGEGAKQPYVVAQTVATGGYELYPYAARNVSINGTIVALDNVRWTLVDASTSDIDTASAAPTVAPTALPIATTDASVHTVTYRAVIVDASETPVLTVDRRYHLEPGDYHLRVEQRLTNHTDGPLEIVWEQNGQGDPVNDDAAYLGDRRMFVAGYFDINPKYELNYSRDFIYTKNAFIARTDLVSADNQAELAAKFGGTFIDFRAQRDSQGNIVRDSNGQPILIEPDRGFVADLRPLWPNPDLSSKNTELAWIASENRYFVVATMPNVADDVATHNIPAMDELFPRLGVRVIGQKGPKRQLDDHGLVLTLGTNPTTIAAGASTSVDFAIYAGPRKKEVFQTPPYERLFFMEMIRYELGCALCTFQWLARFLLSFLEFIHGLVFDWGVAIIILVIVVRGLLHPITKRSQINMMRMSKQMASIQPEIEKLKKKYGDDKQKIQQEQMRLFRERGVNPLNMLGCLPMFLQMPIWVALYAMLYYAIELRHESAFYGVFQWLSNGNWAFLADLSQPDNFIRFAGEGYTLTWLPFVNPHFAGINVIPILMAVVFFIQQKLMTPPAQNEQQAQQQKMMRFMTLLFPVFLYSAPSGLTLYMVASTAAGIIDSTIVRRHIKREEEAGTLLTPKEKKAPGRFGQWAARMQAEMQSRQEEAMKQKNQGKSNNKKRKPKR